MAKREHSHSCSYVPARLDYRRLATGEGFMERWRRVLLIFELFLFALILVLPQVDLPDFTSHRSTAPIGAKASRSFAAIVCIVLIATKAPSLRHTEETRGQLNRLAIRPNALSLLSLFCILLC